MGTRLHMDRSIRFRASIPEALCLQMPDLRKLILISGDFLLAHTAILSQGLLLSNPFDLQVKVTRNPLGRSSVPEGSAIAASRLLRPHIGGTGLLDQRALGPRLQPNGPKGLPEGDLKALGLQDLDLDFLDRRSHETILSD